MTSWLEAVPAFGMALLILGVPGAAVVTALRIRGLPALCLAPAVSVSVAAVSAVVAPLIHLPWGWPVLLLGTAIATAAAWLARRFIPALQPAAGAVPAGPAAPHRRRASRATLQAAVAGVLVALAVTTVFLVVVSPSPGQFTQGYDSVFHLNATEYAVETRNASSFAISGFILPAGASVFYPGAWHGLASLLVISTGISVPAATNILWLAVAGLVWPLSCVFLARTVFGERRVMLLAAGALAAAFPAFPYLLLQYGSAYPNMLSNALVPAGAALVLLILSPSARPPLEPALALAAIVLFLPGLAMAQPNGVFSILLVLTPLLVQRVWLWLRKGFADSRGQGWTRAAVLAASVAAVAGGLLSLPQVRGLFNYTSPAFLPFPLAFLRNITQAPAPIWFPAAALLLLVLAGAWTAAKVHGRRWVPASLLLVAFTYPLSSGTNLPAANVVMAPWWDNPERIAALMPLVAVPLAALGVDRLAGWLPTRHPRVRLVSRRGGTTTAAAALAVVLAFSNPGFWQMAGAVGQMYNVPAKPDSLAQVDAQELALIHRLDSLTTPKDVIANNPYNGSALAMALAGRHMLFPYSSQGSLTADQYTLRFWLNRVGSDQAVCAAAKRLGVTYLLDFGTDYIPAFNNPRSLYPGVTLASGTQGFTLVARDGHAALYKLTLCAGVPV
ncbi:MULTISPECIES: DUF6541 family protein [unclassified Arthrobacter]|uniref:DUF6541 family protein n=1 Tax=unclassified Arthrobacter TaxID=235627 RepID=UPI00159D2F4D|nr:MULTISPECIES: DUF6541 family protein [unclassified Arthrobacter]MCQ9164835.1 hypothetical protein [Arthrobacter sp. STN4]NVM98716.1 hypothetical protein [Arthrobacter sp. SDTb3-6]